MDRKAYEGPKVVEYGHVTDVVLSVQPIVSLIDHGTQPPN